MQGLGPPWCCRVSSDSSALEVLHNEHHWIPGPLQIRPNLETQQRKVSQMENVEAFYGCIDDFIYDLVFEFKMRMDSSGKLRVVMPAQPARAGNNLKQKVFSRNEFAYDLTPGTTHSLMWYYAGDSRLSDKPLAVVSQAIGTTPRQHAHACGHQLPLVEEERICGACARSESSASVSRRSRSGGLLLVPSDEEINFDINAALVREISTNSLGNDHRDQSYSGSACSGGVGADRGGIGDLFEFVWYENPKMTIPGVFHVQVFWHRLPSSSATAAT